MFFCHNRFQEFNVYEHKFLNRSYFFGRCLECGKYFHIKDDEIIEGRVAKAEYKYLRKDITPVIPIIKFLKSLCFGVSTRNVKTIYELDENNKIKTKDIFQENEKGEIELDKKGNPIVIAKQKIVSSRIITEYQHVKINNRGKLETITNTLEMGLKPRIWEEKALITA